jgi:hypothetical protein
VDILILAAMTREFRYVNNIIEFLFQYVALKVSCSVVKFLGTVLMLMPNGEGNISVVF